ncbi:ROK family protein [Thiotrichales bacterium HSG1]|nr:ROK family protein [Thiotrichales bacterium HSG1]
MKDAHNLYGIVMEILGIDVGGSGIKGAPVNVETAKLTADRHRIVTPEISTPDAISEVIVKLTQHFAWQGPIGCTFPAVVKQGIVKTAANIDKSWIGVNGEKLISSKTGCQTLLLNDADAAGFAEMEFGAGKGNNGIVIIHTFGTGIGSAIFVNGQLVPNTEFGRLEIRCKEAEQRASARNRTEEGLKWKTWTLRVNEFLAHMEALFWPDLFIIGGGVSRKHDKFLHLLKARADIVPAQLLNQAGIIGAAVAAGKKFGSDE